MTKLIKLILESKLIDTSEEEQERISLLVVMEQEHIQKKHQ